MDRKLIDNAIEEALKRCKEMGDKVIADIYCMGHCHHNAYTKRSIKAVDSRNNKIMDIIENIKFEQEIIYCDLVPIKQRIDEYANNSGDTTSINRLKDIYKKYPQAEENFLTMFSNYEHFDAWYDKLEYQISQDGLLLKPVFDPLEMTNALDVRNKVFVQEQGVNYEDEVVIEEEKEAKAFVIYLKDKCIGTVRYRLVNNEYKIERFAILKEYRSKGYGRAVMNYFVQMLADRFNPCVITLNAQIQVVDFYKSLGFEIASEEFLEAGIRHYKMIKKY